ncbi:MAG: hypothetical protein LIO86_06800, partial [Lachnospiraceae bacterium]|nr:hypothetical protein [Lachnospiraceae bacterium]
LQCNLFNAMLIYFMVHDKVTFLPVCPKVLHFQFCAEILTKRRQMTSEERNFCHYNDETT